MIGLQTHHPPLISLTFLLKTTPFMIPSNNYHKSIKKYPNLFFLIVFEIFPLTMANSTKLLLHLFFLLTPSLALPDAYDILQSHNLPIGLLPEGVESFLLSPDGSFDVYFGSECQFKLKKKYLLSYKRKISGKLEDGAIRSLDGVSVNTFWIIWLPVTDIIRDGDSLNLYVGPISTSFPVSVFSECPKCRDASSSASATSS